MESALPDRCLPSCARSPGRSRLRYVLVAFASFVLYWGLTTRLHFDFRPTWFPVFVYEGQAFLEGHLDLRGTLPLNGQDLSYYKGRYYPYWPPLPAAISLPAVMVWGLQASDKFIGVALAGLNVLLVGLLLDLTLRRGWLDLSARTIVVLQIFYALGTEPFACVLMGGGPNYALVLQETCLLCSLICLFSWPEQVRGALWGGLFWCGCILTRAHSVLLAPFYVSFLVTVPRGSSVKHGLWTRLLCCGAGAVLGTALWMGWNYVRFESPFISGGEYVIWDAVNRVYLMDSVEHGMFSLWYIPQNLYTQLVKPMFHLRAGFPYLAGDAVGDGILLTTPLWWLLIGSAGKIVRHWLLRACLYGAGSMWALLLIFYTTGGCQFGMRYLMDFLPLMLICLAGAVGPRPSRAALWLLGASIGLRWVGTYLYLA